MDISELDKIFITQIFNIFQDKNIKCTIFVTKDAYGIRIKNPEIRLVIQYNISLSFDLIFNK